MRLLHPMFAFGCLFSRIIAFMFAYYTGDRNSDPEVVLYDKTQIADPSAEAFRYRLADRVLDALDHDRGPKRYSGWMV